ncbi:hypothetical protein, partial [Aeromonas caviae]|uniref:hypothetical protein n=1 Tax=Aeromonas caviae TaxID=648 RepID=UPI002AB3F186
MKATDTLPPLSFSSQFAVRHLRYVNNRFHGVSREMDCRLAILMALIEAWEGVVDRNLSWFNQLVSNCRSSWLLGEQNSGKSPHPNP